MAPDRMALIKVSLFSGWWTKMKGETRKQLEELEKKIEAFMVEPENYSKRLDLALANVLDWIRDELQKADLPGGVP